MSDWFPRLNRRGEVTAEGPQRWQAQWLDDDRQIWQNGLATVVDGQWVGAAYVQLAAGGGLWAGSNGGRIFTSLLASIEDAADPSYSRNGSFSYVSNPQSNDKRLVLNWTDIVDTGTIIESRVSDSLIVWMNHGLPYGRLVSGGPIVQLAPDGGRPVPIDTPNGPWFLLMRGGGLWLAPFGSDKGIPHLLGSGQVFYPDGVYLDGAIKVAFTDEHGTLSTPSFPLSTPLQSYPVAGPPIVIPPPPQPEPPKETPVSVPDKSAEIIRIRAHFPTPLGAYHPDFLIAVARATGAKLLRKEHGTKIVLPSGVSVSQDILVFNEGADCYDILSDAEGAARPSWQPKGAIAGEYVDVSAAPPPADDEPDEPPADEDDLRVVLARIEAKLDAIRKHFA